MFWSCMQNVQFAHHNVDTWKPTAQRNTTQTRCTTQHNTNPLHNATQHKPAAQRNTTQTHCTTQHNTNPLHNATQHKPAAQRNTTQTRCTTQHNTNPLHNANASLLDLKQTPLIRAASIPLFVNYRHSAEVIYEVKRRPHPGHFYDSYKCMYGSTNFTWAIRYTTT